MASRCRSICLDLALVCLAVGCGGGDGDGQTDSASGATTTGAHADGALPRGGVNMEVYAASEQTCPPGNIHLDVGNLRAAPPVLVVEGTSGAHVRCTVAGTEATGFSATGTISAGADSFSFGDLTTDGSSATGSVSFVDPASGQEYSSAGAGRPCVFQFAPGTDQGVEAGRIWVGFDCSDLVNTANPGQRCASRYGSLLVSNCGME